MPQRRSTHGHRTSARAGIALLMAALLAACNGRERAATPPMESPHAAIREPFVDQATASGIDFVHFGGASGELFLPEMMGSGAALLDCDNDGDLDAYLVQGSHLLPGAEPLFPPPPAMLPLRDRLYRNDLAVAADGPPRLSFTDITAHSGIEAHGYGMGVATGDIDNDGRIDLYLTTLGSNQMYLNTGNCTFVDITAQSGADDPRWSASATFLDYDQDGWLDLYVTNYVDFTVAGRKLCRSLTGAKDYCGPLAYRPLTDRLFRNRGDGTFKDISGIARIASVAASGLGVVSGDFDRDGRIDIYVANDGMPNLLWTQRGDALVNVAMESGSALSGDGQAEAGMGVAVGDFDADGDEDVLVTHLALETNTLYRNTGQGLFDDLSVATGLGSPSWPYTGFGTAWIDFDNDGWLDLLAVNGAVKVIPELAARGDSYPLGMPNQLYHNQSGVRFTDVSSAAGELFEMAEVSRGVAIGDVDNDGDPDVLMANNSGPARLLINQMGQDQHWLGLRLLGQRYSRDMLGAWVGVHRTDGLSVWRRVRTGGSYLSASDPRLLFGLSQSLRIERVTIRWPDGQWEEFEVETDRYSTLCQGSGGSIAPPV